MEKKKCLLLRLWDAFIEAMRLPDEDEDYYEMQSKKVQKQFESLLVQDEEIAVQIKNVLEMVKET